MRFRPVQRRAGFVPTTEVKKDCGCGDNNRLHVVHTTATYASSASAEAADARVKKVVKML